MEEYVIKDYQEFLEEEELEHNEETLNLYIGSLTYELKDNLELECENFCVPKDLEGIEAQRYIEEEIEKIIINYYKGE